MIARLLLVLMLALGAIPGMAAGAACHESTSVMAAAMPGMAPHHGHPAPAEHRCIGCTPLPDLLAARRPVAPARTRPPRPMPARLDLSTAGPPALPPPRIG
ncbi:hypothetical protein [uncultured Sphingomonas sp.]|uniref:hypothetical protein n=1 Tax=uncultured Sphingomonas sp. TaxID=158754 RepID=UPI0035CC3C29